MTPQHSERCFSIRPRGVAISIPAISIGLIVLKEDKTARCKFGDSLAEARRTNSASHGLQLGQNSHKDPTNTNPQQRTEERREGENRQSHLLQAPYDSPNVIRNGESAHRSSSFGLVCSNNPFYIYEHIINIPPCFPGFICVFLDGTLLGVLKQETFLFFRYKTNNQ